MRAFGHRAKRAGLLPAGGLPPGPFGMTAFDRARGCGGNRYASAGARVRLDFRPIDRSLRRSRAADQKEKTGTLK